MSAEDHDQKNNDAHDDIPDTPGVIAHPPLIYAGRLSAGLLASYFLPVTFLPRTVARVLGWLLIGSGLILGFLGDCALRNAGTNINPYEPVTTIVVEGPYRFTRNPSIRPGGGILGLAGLGEVEFGLWYFAVLVPGEIAFALVLFIDAADINLPDLWGEPRLLLGFLALRLLLTIALGRVRS